MKKNILLLFLVSFSLSNLAQEKQPPMARPPGGGIPTPPSAPINNSVYLLVIAGVVYGIKKLRKNESLSF